MNIVGNTLATGIEIYKGTSATRSSSAIKFDGSFGGANVKLGYRGEDGEFKEYLDDEPLECPGQYELRHGNYASPMLLVTGADVSTDFNVIASPLG